MPPCKVALSSMRNKILPIFPSQLVSGKCSSESLSWLLWFGDFVGLCFVGRRCCGSSRLSKLQWPDPGYTISHGEGSKLETHHRWSF